MAVFATPPAITTATSVVVVSAATEPIAGDLDPNLVAALEQVLDRAKENPAIPGVLLYVHIPGQGSWRGARGLADRAIGTPMAPGDRFRFASITKTMVATVVLQLAEAGHLTLDDTVARWLPGLVPGGEYISLRHLLTHTSGLPDYLDSNFVRAAQSDPARIWAPHELVAAALTRPLRFAPGAPGRWYYANTNYILLGMVVEQVTGKSLAHEIRWRILEPLSMENTYFDPDPARAEGGAVHGYVGGRDYTDINFSLAWAAGGIVSTTEEIGRFAQALFRGALLGDESRKTMLSFVGVNGAWGTKDLVYGAGVMQNILRGDEENPFAFTVLGHTGSLAGYRSAMWHLPDQGITVVAAANQMFADPNRIVVEALVAVSRHNSLSVQASPGLETTRS